MSHFSNWALQTYYSNNDDIQNRYLFATFLDSIFGGLGTVDLLEGLRDEPSSTF